MDQQPNPYAAPSAPIERPPQPHRPPTGRVRFWFAQIFAVILVAGSVPATMLALWDIESIIGSGLVAVLLSLALIPLASPRVLRLLIPIAVTMLLIVGGIVFAINWLPIFLVGLRFRRMTASFS